MGRSRQSNKMLYLMAQERQGVFFTRERALWTAVLRQALLDYSGTPCDGVSVMGPDKIFRSAEAWIRSPSRALYSFLWVCDILNIEPEMVIAQGVLDRRYQSLLHQNVPRHYGKNRPCQKKPK